MAQALMAVKVAAILGCWCMTTTVQAQSYGKCAYGSSRYNNNTCPAIAVAQKTDTLHVATAKTASVIRVYPNPAQHYCMVQLPQRLLHQSVKVLVLNSQQEQVTVQSFAASALLHKIPLPVLANGMYQVKVVAGNTILSAFIEVQH